MSNPGTQPILALQSLALIRGERQLFAGIELELAAGAALVLTGPNGSGKSSLLRLLAGLARPAAGRILWRGADIAEDLAAYRTRLHLIGHQDGTRAALTVGETLEFWLELAGGGSCPVPEALGAMGLAALADTPCRFLSAGQRRRLALARLAGAVRPLWLLDEPAVGLDRAALAALSDLIASHRRAGGIVILSTHQDLKIADAQSLHLDGAGVAAA